MGFLGLPDVPRDEDTHPRLTSVVVTVVGQSEPCGCQVCSAQGIGTGNLFHETHVGVGASSLLAVKDALRQARERHQRAELSVECWRVLAA